uniref:Uncharacterized protein n=1 Tax=Opuntia streptacantha TaxID=393608 RepID=A0A7C9ET04_OPUST
MPLSKFLRASSSWGNSRTWTPSFLRSTFVLASGTSFVTLTSKSPTCSSWTRAIGQLGLLSTICLIAATALKTETSTNKLWRRNAFLSRICRSSAVLQGIAAKIANSFAHGLWSCLPSLPWPPPFPPQFSSSTGRGGKTDGLSATTGGTTHVFARKP